jgi:hypothetical protein
MLWNNKTQADDVDFVPNVHAKYACVAFEPDLSRNQRGTKTNQRAESFSAIAGWSCRCGSVATAQRLRAALSPLCV